MNYTRFWKIALSAFLLIGLTTACEDDGEETTPEEEVNTQILLDDYEANKLMSSMADMGTYYVGAALTADGGGRLEEECPEVTHQVARTRVLIDFGTECQDNYGNTHSGLWIVDYTLAGGELRAYTVTTESYTFNDMSVVATLNYSDITIGNGTLSITSNGNIALSFGDGSTFSRSGSYTLLWETGFRDGDPGNDLVTTTGSGQGTNRNGGSFTYTIEEPLVRNTSCAGDLKLVTVSGRKRVVPARSGSYSVDFGDGACDRSVTIITDSRTFNIDLP